MALLKEFYELEIGDQFLTTDDMGKAVKYTVDGVSQMTGVVSVKETLSLVDQEEYYVIGNIHD